MKTDRIPLSRALRVAAISAPLLIGLPAHAQQNGFSTNEFYRQGDAFSEKVSGFFSGLFKGGRSSRAATPPPSYPTPAPYQQAPVSAASSRSTPSATYREAPSTGAVVQPQVVTSTKPKSSSTRSKRSSTSSNVASSTPKQTKVIDSDGYYTSAPKKSERESVVMAPKSQETPPPMETASNNASSDGISPYAITGNDSTLSVPPSNTSKTTTPSKPSTETKTTSPSTSPQPTVSAGQEFPMGTVGKKPGRVVSPYPPHNELDVRGLPSGSLALDPTTQKVFKVP
ncbi:MAG: hypothetical protein JNM99_17010 [Verrucomicrobiaceae bacterium]|nr:hypothetical protein [Verrucomicrobiaceae bacterium]